MGVWSYAAIIIGATKKQFGDKFTIENGKEGFIKDNKFVILEETDLEWVESAWDTQDPEKIIYGFIYEMSDMHKPININIEPNTIEELKTEFKKLTGIKANVMLSPMMG